MAKITDAVVTTLKGYFDTGDTPTEAQFDALIDAIQGGVEGHDHAGEDEGDSAKIDDTMCGDRVPQFYRRQGGSATDWPDEGTTTRTPTTVRMQAGAKSDSCSGSAGTWATSLTTITFPQSFSAKPIVFVTLGAVSLEAGESISCFATDVTTTNFSLYLQAYDSVTNTTAVMNWLAIGPQ